MTGQALEIPFVRLSRARVSATGLYMPDDLPFDEWATMGDALSQAEKCIHWWIGDWWRFGEKKYGERKAIIEADDWNGPSYKTCRNAASVAGKFELSRRRDNLTFNHHAEVAALTKGEADRLLNWSQESISVTGKPRTIEDLRKAVRASIRANKKSEYNKRIENNKPKYLEGTYRIFYIDPPWKYHGLNQVDEHGHAEAHYECLDDNQLMAFKPDGKRLIKGLADENAVMFIWVTSPLLRRCFPIIEAWGFDYKAGFIWDKIKHNMGFYNSVRHEHLLIATRGACTPDVPKLFGSVQSIERSDKHSEKPHEFYGIIEKLYDHGRKLEIFARSGRDGWDSIGNEIERQQAAA